MGWLHRLAALGAGLIAALALTGAREGPPRDGLDTLQLPPETQILYSPLNGQKLVIERPTDIYNNDNVTVSLYEYQEELIDNQYETEWVKKWSKEPDTFAGPRYVFVGDNGSVIFIDEWFYGRNYGADMELIRVYGPEEDEIVTKSLQDVLDVVGCSSEEALKHGDLGTWVSQTPNWRERGTIGIYICEKIVELSLDPVKLEHITK